MLQAVPGAGGTKPQPSKPPGRKCGEGRLGNRDICDFSIVRLRRGPEACNERLIGSTASVTNAKCDSFAQSSQRRTVPDAQLHVQRGTMRDAQCDTQRSTAGHIMISRDTA